MIQETVIDAITNNISLPTAPEIDINKIESILGLWNFSDSAFEVTSVFQNILGRLPPYFLAYFALSLMFIVIGLLAHLISRIL